MFSNYGDLPNEMLIYAYGFGFETNHHDSVAIKMGKRDNGGILEKTFYVTSGPNLTGVPKV